ncbi:MAG: NfeD family protein [Bacteroidales bacterium]
MEIVIVTTLLILAIILILIEIFVLPGITVGGIAGGILAIIGLYYSFHTFGVTGLILTAVISVCLFILFFYICIKSKLFDKAALKKELNFKITDTHINKLHAGERLTTVSRLNPMGKVTDGENFFEAKSESGFIEENKIVVVIRIDRNTVVVENEK